MVDLFYVFYDFLTAGPHEICHMKSYNLTCGQSEAIVMATARYGRMRLGLCVKGNYGVLGCETNVLPYIDSRCSGRPTCTLSVPDPLLHEKGSCPDEFSSYLEVSYSCVKGKWNRSVTKSRLFSDYLFMM